MLLTFSPRRREERKGVLTSRRIQEIFASFVPSRLTFCDDAEQSFVHRDNIRDAHVAEIRFGGHIALQPGTQRFAEEISEDRECNRNRDQEDAPKVGADALHRHKSKERREQSRSRNVRTTSLMDSEFAFPRANPLHRFVCCLLNIFSGKVAHQIKTCGIGMACHVLARIFAGKDVECCMFHRVISSGFE